MNKEQLVEDINNNLTIRKIAEKRSVSFTTVRYWLGKYGLKTLSKDVDWDIEKLKGLCRVESSLHRVIIGMGKSPTSASYKIARRLFEEYDIVPPVFEPSVRVPFDLDDYFSSGVRRTNQRSKTILIEFYAYEDKCSLCGLGDSWNGKALTLQLDHIDGDNLNNEISNLRIICPNCHTQTPTYCRNKNTS